MNSSITNFCDIQRMEYLNRRIGFSRRRYMIRLTSWALPLLPLVLTCVMVLGWPIFSPGLQYILVFVDIISALLALSVAMAPKRIRSVSGHAMSPAETPGDLPAVPRTRADLFARMD